MPALFACWPVAFEFVGGGLVEVDLLVDVDGLALGGVQRSAEAVGAVRGCSFEWHPQCDLGVGHEAVEVDVVVVERRAVLEEG